MTGTRDEAAATWALVRELTASSDIVAQEHAFMRDAGLSAGPVRALRALLELGPAPMVRLAEHLGCDGSYVTGLIKTLTAHHLVTASPSPRDGRVKVIELTDAGRAVARDAQRMHETPPNALAKLSESDLRAVRNILSRAFDNGQP